METYNYYRMFGCFNRKFKVSESQPPPDVRVAFATYCGRETHMSADQLLEFLIEYQGEISTLSDAEGMIQQFLQQRHHTTNYPDRGLTLEDFFHFLFFDDLNGPITSQVHQDMTAPLQHYFIYTGHNSYLTGNQLSSDCSEIPIAKALERGVRVIELDLWPNNSNTDVHVLHGRTLTTPVPLIKCLKSIKQHAFIKSPYPVILTLEDHLTSDLQAKVAEMVTQIFGDMLYYPEQGISEDFPSPEALKYHIILSTKPPKEYLESKQIKEKENAALLERCLSEKEPLGKEISDLTEEPEADERNDSDQDEACVVGETEYKRLIAIHASKPKYGLRHALITGIDKIKRLSLSEQEYERAATCYGNDVVRFTQKNLLRVYPKGTRVSSSNFRPMTGWIHGTQMIAFNMQGYGKSLWQMHGMFRSNGNCGYVKKPKFLLLRSPSNEVFNPKLPLPVRKTLKVKVYLGDGWRLDFSHTHFDTYSPPDFYTKLYIVGVPQDAAKTKTKIITDDWAPMWDEEFTFPLAVPEVALLQIEVREHDMSDKDDFGGQTCLPVSELRPGIRSVPLYDKKGDKFPSVKLLMRFRFV